MPLLCLLLEGLSLPQPCFQEAQDLYVANPVITVAWKYRLAYIWFHKGLVKDLALKSLFNAEMMQVKS